ncbi:MAG: tetratricopeptide repeat protein [Acidobacteria bacterium]|nr:tetratricopeptide repeat protein [Acidobacteriota bacterium]
MPISPAERLASLKALLEEDPNDAFVHYGIADAYYKLGELESCIEHVEKYLKLADDEGAVYRIWGHALLRLERMDEARQAFEKGVEAAERHNHPGMADEYRDTIEQEWE